MNWNGTLFKPVVAWRTEVREVVLVSYFTETDPSIYKLRVSPIDITNPGASTADIAVGYYLMDYLGHIYRITEINIGSDSQVIKVSDDFRWNSSPINGRQGIVYKSVGEGTAPWLAATYGTHLYYSAANTAAGIDNAILWKMGEEVKFTSTDYPELTDYQTNYLIPYGKNPELKLYQIDDSGNKLERTEKPYFIMSGENIVSVGFPNLDIVGDWIIKISR